jgi:hypothetical protein
VRPVPSDDLDRSPGERPDGFLDLSPQLAEAREAGGAGRFLVFDGNAWLPVERPEEMPALGERSLLDRHRVPADAHHEAR